MWLHPQRDLDVRARMPSGQQGSSRHLTGENRQRGRRWGEVGGEVLGRPLPAGPHQGAGRMKVGVAVCLARCFLPAASVKVR